MSVAAASASTRSRGCFVAQGERNSRCERQHLVLDRQGPPACRRAVARSATDRSPRPASAVPFRILAISSASGRRSRPSNASLRQLGHADAIGAFRAVGFATVRSALNFHATAPQIRVSPCRRASSSILATTWRRDRARAAGFVRAMSTFGRPGLGDEARADAQPQHRRRLAVAAARSDRLTDQAAAARRDRGRTRCGRSRRSRSCGQRAVERAAFWRRKPAAICLRS